MKTLNQEDETATRVPDIDGFLAVTRRIPFRHYDGTNPNACVVAFPAYHDLYDAYAAWLERYGGGRRGRDSSLPESFIADYFALPLDDVSTVWSVAALGPFTENLPLALAATERVLRHQEFTYYPITRQSSDGYFIEKIDRETPILSTAAPHNDGWYRGAPAAWTYLPVSDDAVGPAILDTEELLAGQSQSVCEWCGCPVVAGDGHVCYPPDVAYTQLDTVARRLFSEGGVPSRVRFSEPFFDIIRRSDRYQRQESGRQILKTSVGILEIDPAFYDILRFEIES